MTAKLGLLAATILVGAFLNGPNIDTVLDATEPGATGDDGAARTLVVAIAAQVAMVLGATALAVFKPAGRLGGLRRAG